MKPSNQIFLATLFLIALASTACRDATETGAPTSTATPTVYVVNYPLQYFAERIGGDRVEVRFPAPRDVDPAEWSPDDETILRYQQADLILLNGADYARWVRHSSLPAERTVDTSRHFHDRLLEVPDAVAHSHGPDGHTHSHAGTAFTTWLDPLLAIEHAREVKGALDRLVPGHTEEFEERFQSLASDLRALDDRLADAVAAHPDQPLLASHPVYHYLEARYSLNLESLHWEPDEMPSTAEWEALDAILEEHPARWILWEDEPLAEIVERLNERNVSSIVFNPCGQPPESGDFLSVMRDNAEKLAVAFSPGSGD